MSFFLYGGAVMGLNPGIMAQLGTKSGQPGKPADSDTRAGVPGFEDLLVAVGQTRNRDAFIRLFEHYAPRVKSFLIKAGVSADEADELAQETMLTVWRRADTYDPARAAAGTWIYTIARNKRIDALRKKQAQPLAPVPVDEMFALPALDTPSPHEALARADEQAAIAAALAELPAEQAEVLHKSFFENKTQEEIARETDVPLGTVKSRMRLAVERLRRRMTPEDAP